MHSVKAISEEALRQHREHEERRRRMSQPVEVAPKKPVTIFVTVKPFKAENLKPLAPVKKNVFKPILVVKDRNQTKINKAFDEHIERLSANRSLEKEQLRPKMEAIVQAVSSYYGYEPYILMQSRLKKPKWFRLRDRHLTVYLMLETLDCRKCYVTEFLNINETSVTGARKYIYEEMQISPKFLLEVEAIRELIKTNIAQLDG
jgi:hypothetical protein